MCSSMKLLVHFVVW